MHHLSVESVGNKNIFYHSIGVSVETANIAHHLIVENLKNSKNILHHSSVETENNFHHLTVKNVEIPSVENVETRNNLYHSSVEKLNISNHSSV